MGWHSILNQRRTGGRHPSSTMGFADSNSYRELKRGQQSRPGVNLKIERSAFKTPKIEEEREGSDGLPIGGAPNVGGGKERIE